MGHRKKNDTNFETELKEQSLKGKRLGGEHRKGKDFLRHLRPYAQKEAN